MIRAAFFDVDGTLVSFRTHAIPESALSALRALRAAGVRTLLSTGRNGDSTRFLMDTGLFDGEILLSGQLCRLDGAVVFENPIAPADLEAAIAGAEAGELTLGFLSGDDSFVSGVNEFVTAACAYAGMARPRVAPPALARTEPIYQMHIYGAPGSEDALLRRARGLEAVRWSPNFADVFPRGGGKERGLEAVCRALGIGREETIAFGDGENDVGMLACAGIGVDMGGASEAVKVRADYVTADVDADGIARALEHFSGCFVQMGTQGGREI